MRSHKIYEVSWSEDGRKQKSCFAEIDGTQYFEYPLKDALSIKHRDIHDAVKKWPSLCIRPNFRLEDYYDSVRTIRTVIES